MKTKKVFTLSVFLVAMCLLIVLFFGFVMGSKTAQAEEMTNDATVSVSSEMGQDNAVESGGSAEKAEHTVWTRLSEWFSRNFLEFITSVDLAVVVGSAAAILIDGKSNKKSDKETRKAININTEAMNENTESNNQVLQATNLLIDGVNDLSAREDIRDTDIKQVLFLSKSVLEILVMVYTNNKNLPQATKDFVNLKYVNALKSATNETPGETKESAEE